MNQADAAEEDRRTKLPKNWQAQRARVEWEMKEEAARKVARHLDHGAAARSLTDRLLAVPTRQAAEARGEDYERLKRLHVQADADDRRAAKRRRTDEPGFSGAPTARHTTAPAHAARRPLTTRGMRLATDFATAQYKQYRRLTTQMRVSEADIERSKAQYGEAYYATADSLVHGTHAEVPRANAERMVKDLEKQCVAPAPGAEDRPAAQLSSSSHRARAQSGEAQELPQAPPLRRNSRCGLYQ